MQAKSDHMVQLRESCGLIGIHSFGKNDVSFGLFSGLVALQHRGQDSAGICTYDTKSAEGNNLRLKKGMGLVSEVFPGDEYLKLNGFAGIGHVRYPTIGVLLANEAHPILWSQGGITVAAAQNGNVANYGALRKKLEKSEGFNFQTKSDTELLAALFCSELAKTGSCFAAAEKCMKTLDGSYATVIMTSAGDLVAFRDVHAIKPLLYGQDNDKIIFASESVALDINSIPIKEDLKPGEIMVVDAKGRITRQVFKSGARRASCMFEYVYFSRPDSTMDGRLVYSVRQQLGRLLARQRPTEADLIVAVPDTARAAAEGYSEQTKLPVVEGLIKNRYVGRTFIMPSQAKRLASVRLKLNAVSGLVKGKRIILLDDSIVRGTTMGPIVRLLKDAGATEVHVRITCPPIISPCFYGIDIPTYRELIATRMSVEQIAKHIGADSLEYISIDNLVAAIGMKKNELCLGCVTGDYVTEYGKKLAIKLKKEENVDVATRIWEQDIK